MRFMKFTIICDQCGHKNMPDNNTRNGIFKTLTGEFNTCRNCGYIWKNIYVPLRPLVENIVLMICEDGPGFSDRVTTFSYKGKVPCGSGI